jgi:hypothetical protein
MTNPEKTDLVERLRELLAESERNGFHKENIRWEAVTALPALLEAVEALEMFAKLKPEFAEDDGGVGIVLAFRDEEGATFGAPLSMIRKAQAALATLKGEG